MIQITEQAAQTVLRLLEDVAAIDDRARCSDAYFRQHFVNMAKLPPIRDAANEIKVKLETQAEAETCIDTKSTYPAGIASKGRSKILRNLPE